MGWLFKSEQEKWDEQIRNDRNHGDWIGRSLASRMEVCPRNPSNGGRGSKQRDGKGPTFPWGVDTTEGAQAAKSKGWWK